jgi:hypothetical protein
MTCGGTLSRQVDTETQARPSSHGSPQQNFGWKATAWNLALLEKHATPGQRATSGDYLFVVLCAVVLIAAAVIPLLVLFAFGSWLERMLRTFTS